MQYIQTYRRAIAIASGLLFGAAGISPAFAAGTPVGTNVDNNVTMDFTVNGTNQTTNATAGFVVDRKLVLDLTTQDSDWVTVFAGQTTAATGVPAMNFRLTNLSNDSTDVIIGLANRNLTPVTTFSAVGASGFTDAGVIVAIDNGNQAYDQGLDTPLTLNAAGYYEIPTAMAADDVIDLVVAADVPGAAGAASYASYTLVAALSDSSYNLVERDQSGGLAPTTALGPDFAANGIGTQETVFADLDGASPAPEDIEYDFLAPIGALASVQVSQNGQVADTSGLVTGSTVAIAKHVEVIYDPITGNRYDGSGNQIFSGADAVEPKAIPGAVMMYVIGLINDSAALTASSVDVSDDIPDGSGSPELVDEGDQANPTVPIEVPNAVSFSVGANTFNPSLTGVTNLDQVYVEDCAGSTSTNNYNGAGVVVGGNDTAATEFTFNVGDCDAGDSAFLVYFVTVN